MSNETSEWLNSQIMIGMGKTSWWIEGSKEDHPNHYPGPLERSEIRSKLLGWVPNTEKIYDADMQPIDGYIRLVPSDDPKATLGIHTDGYQVHGYDELLDASPLGIASAGLLRQRRVFWVSFAREGEGATISTPEGIDFLPYLTASTSMDGSMATTVHEHVTFVQCDNTLAVAQAEGDRFKIKHTSKSGSHWLKDSVKAMEKLDQVADEMSQEISTLAGTDVTERQWAQFLDEWCPLPDKQTTKTGGPGRSYTMAENRRTFLDEMYHTDQRVAPWAGTAFGVLQAVNTYANHHVIVKRSDSDMDVTAARVERNMLRTVAGKWAEIDQGTLKTLEKVLQDA